MAISTRVWTAGCAGAMVLIAAGGVLLGVQPQLAHADETNAAAAATEAQVTTTQAKLTALSKVAATQSALEAKAVVLGKAVPSALQANTFIRRVNAVAGLDAVAVQSIAVGSATAYTSPAPVVAAATTTAAATPAPSASASAAATPVVTTPTVPVLAKTDPLITAADFTIIPMTIVVKGTRDAGLAFVKDLQRDERLYLVSGYSTSVDPDDASAVTTTLTGSVYALKD